MMKLDFATTVKEGEPWTICGEMNINATSGTITSPLYPQTYPMNVRCQWIIELQENRTLTLR